MAIGKTEKDIIIQNYLKMSKYPLYRSKDGFLGLEEKDRSSYEDSQAVIIPFGLEASVSYGSGTRNGPKAMIEASHEVELFDITSWQETFRTIGISTLEEPIIKKDIALALDQLEEMVNSVLSDDKFPFVFGGEHSITAGAVRPFVKKHSEITILHFDAHADLRDGYDGEHYSHASALRRCLDFDNVSLVSFGIRNISAEEVTFLEENKGRVKIYYAQDKKKWNIEEIVSNFKDKTVYLSFDVDAFDASLMPATGTPEPGGLFWDEVIDIISQVSKVSNIVGADINELSPIKGFHSCDFLAAKLAYKILSLIFCIKK
jgi:agmatinase